MFLSKRASELGHKLVAEKYAAIAQKIKKGVNQYLWMPGKNYYGQYLYGRNSMSLSPRSEALGEALAVLFGIAGSEQQKKIVSNTPVTDF
jgi:neutral trehalase